MSTSKIDRPDVATSRLFVCSGCGSRVALNRLIASSFRCPRFGSGDDVDHVLEPIPDGAPGSWHVGPPDRGELSSFVRYRQQLTAWHLARSHGFGDEDVVSVIRSIDASIAGLEGTGFVITELRSYQPLDTALGFTKPGSIWVKNETVNVSGSHKGRHLFGVMLYLEILKRLHDADREVAVSDHAVLAIASCGNAALASGCVARAANRRLTVFIPPWADETVVLRLRALGADIVICERRPGESGDPCYRRFHEAVDAGAVPFCCQGTDSALTIEGGETIVWEILDQLGEEPVDRMLVQVGGGALASACVRGLMEAAAQGRSALPRFHAVQTTGGFPLARAWARVALRALDEMLLGSPGFDAAIPAEIRAPGAADVYAALRALADATGDDAASTERARTADQRALAACAEGLRSEAGRDAAAEALHAAVRQRSAFMWPWEREPRSLAHGILDDETYDWRAIVQGMLASGGWPVIVSEEQIVEANQLARTSTGIDVDYTGSAGLAGLLALTDRSHASAGTAPVVDPSERVAVIFSGKRRDRE